MKTADINHNVLENVCLYWCSGLTLMCAVVSDVDQYLSNCIKAIMTPKKYIRYRHKATLVANTWMKNLFILYDVESQCLT